MALARLIRRCRFLCVLLLVPAAFAQTRLAPYVPYSDARPILEALAEVLPPELKSANPSHVAAIWPGWVSRRDAEIRARLIQGDEDSIVNFLLFGTSFTRRPRVTAKDLQPFGAGGGGASARSSPEAVEQFGRLIFARLEDFLRALAAPGNNERMRFARFAIENKGHDLTSEKGRAQAKRYLLANVNRVLNEQTGYAKALEAARQLGDTTEEFAERSKLYRDRGLSLDTSLLPNFAVEEALKAMMARGVLVPASVRRVAVVGPGLDFTDKQEGYDFYPPQTIQPFALIDTLLRLALSQANALELTTFDISPRVNDHLARTRERARRGIAYTVQLPRDPARRWKSEALRYWRQLGQRIGVSVRPVAVPAGAGAVEIRAVRVRPAIAARVTPADLNIVVQRLEPATPSEGFDLIVATNIFVYYDVFEQSLALANVERMLRPGGFLLSNNALLELPSTRMRSVDYLTVVYSDRPDDGDHIVWYQRLPN